MYAFGKQIDGRTDGRTDRHTEFLSLDRVCIPCSAVKKLCVHGDCAFFVA